MDNNIFEMFLSYLLAEAGQASYEERCVGRYEDENILISTASVAGSWKPFETALAHPSYNDGELIILESYDTKEDAKAGHDRWESVVKTNTLPDCLTETINSEFKNAMVNGIPNVYAKAV